MLLGVRGSNRSLQISSNSLSPSSSSPFLHHHHLSLSLSTLLPTQQPNKRSLFLSFRHPVVVVVVVRDCCLKTSRNCRHRKQPGEKETSSSEQLGHFPNSFAQWRFIRSWREGEGGEVSKFRQEALPSHWALCKIQIATLYT